jgi:hypothetical protein
LVGSGVFILLSPTAHIAEEPAEKREGGSFAFILGRRGRRIILGVRLPFHSAEEIHGFAGNAIEVFIGNAEAIHDIINGFNMELTGTFEAEAFVFGLAVAFNFGNKDDRYVFAATGTHGCLHSISCKVRSEIW